MKINRVDVQMLAVGAASAGPLVVLSCMLEYLIRSFSGHEVIPVWFLVSEALVSSACFVYLIILKPRN